MIWRIEVKDKEGVFDAPGESIQKDIYDLGISSISKVSVTSVYSIEGQLQDKDIEKIAEELLIDKVIQEYSYNKADQSLPSLQTEDLKVVEIAYNPGVMDPVESSTLKGIRDLGFDSVQGVRTAKKYLLYGKISPKDLDIVVNKILSNKLI